MSNEKCIVHFCVYLHTHVCVRACAAPVSTLPSTTVSGHTVNRVSRFAFPPSSRARGHFVSRREVCNLCQIIRERAINHSSRPSRVTHILLPLSPSPLVFVCTTSTLERSEVSGEREYIRIEWNR